MASEAAEKWYESRKGIKTTVPDGYDAGTASQREVMACGHPKACLSMVDTSKTALVQPDEGDELQMRCTVCEEVRSRHDVMGEMAEEVRGLWGWYEYIVRHGSRAR
jgi:hypothetical protein